MKIAINAQFLNKPNTGTGQYIINLLKVLLEIDKDNEYMLYGEDVTEETLCSTGLLRHTPTKVGVPLAMTKKVNFYTRDDLIRKTIWEKFVFPTAVKSAKGGSAYGGKDKVDLVWSPYFSVSRFRGVKHIMTVHDMIHRIFPQYISNSRWKLYYKFAEKAAKQADQIITVSKCSKKDIVRFLNIEKNKIKTIYLGKPDNKKLEIGNWKLEIDNKYILYIGGFDYRKNVIKLIEAYKIFCESNSNTYLVIAGKLPKQPNLTAPDVEKKVKELGLQGKVRFIGYVADENLPELYKNAEVFVFPTLYEGFGLPVLEAMTYGCSIISSSNSSIPEVAGGSAFLIDPNNAQDLANAIIKVVNNKELRQTMIQNGLEKAQRFSWEKCARETLEAFNLLK